MVRLQLLFFICILSSNQGRRNDENVMRPAKFSCLYVAVAGAALFLGPVASFASSSPYSKYAGIYSSPEPESTDPSVPSAPSFSVSLGPDGSATVTQDTGKGSSTTFGHWNDAGSQITVKFDAPEGQPAVAPMVFQPAHDGLQVVTWDHSFWGKVNPPALKKDDSNWHTSKKHSHI